MEQSKEKHNEAVAFRLFEMRWWSGMSQRRLGEALGLSERRIRQIEYRKIVPDAATLERAAQVLHADLDYILHGTNRPDWVQRTEMRLKCDLDRLTPSQLQDVKKLAQGILQETRRRAQREEPREPR